MRACSRRSCSSDRPPLSSQVVATKRCRAPLILLLALACSLIVANNYYAQPLLPDLRASFHVSSGLIGLCVTLNQLGYAAGLVFLVPLGDLRRRHRLIVTMLAIDAATLAAITPSRHHGIA